ncbi:TPA: hypothetical protein ACH3X3_010461 [Trebouxia sp. C0006]
MPTYGLLPPNIAHCSLTPSHACRVVGEIHSPQAHTICSAVPDEATSVHGGWSPIRRKRSDGQVPAATTPPQGRGQNRGRHGPHGQRQHTSGARQATVSSR